MSQWCNVFTDGGRDQCIYSEDEVTERAAEGAGQQVWIDWTGGGQEAAQAETERVCLSQHNTCYILQYIYSSTYIYMCVVMCV